MLQVSSKGVVHVFGAVEGAEDVAVGQGGGGGFHQRREAGGGVLHHVAGHHDAGAVGQPSFVAQLVGGRFRRAEEQVADAVGEDAVDLLGHGLVVGAQSGFHVRHAEMQLLGRQRSRECRVRVAIDQHPVGLLAHQDLLDAFHHPAGERAVRQTVDSQLVGGFRNPHLLEEKLRHIAVEVLPGMDYNLLYAIVL